MKVYNTLDKIIHSLLSETLAPYKMDGKYNSRKLGVYDRKLEVNQSNTLFQ